MFWQEHMQRQAKNGNRHAQFLVWAGPITKLQLKNIRKLLSYIPRYIMFYVDYAISLIREDEYQTAREMLNKSLTLPKQHQEDEKD